MALELARHLEAMGGVRNHSCLMLHPDDVDGSEIEARLIRAFGEFKAVQYKETLKGWPDGPNQCFVVAARTMLTYSKEPWLWLEADCVTTRPEWADEIEAEHRYCGQPILGVLNDTFGLQNEVTGKHVTGVAVYPYDFYRTCPLLASLEVATDNYRLSGHCPPAFDVYIAPYAVPKCAQAKSIALYWRSRNFVEQDGEVRCSFDSPYGASPVVNMDAALLHGCKDFSLLDIVQSRLLV